MPVQASALETQPEPIDTAIPSPEYPPEALAANFEGSVVLRLLIDETGRVREAKVLKDPGRGLGEAAMRSAIAHFRFEPGRLHDRPSLIGCGSRSRTCSPDGDTSSERLGRPGQLSKGL